MVCICIERWTVGRSERLCKLHVALLMAVAVSTLAHRLVRARIGDVVADARRVARQQAAQIERQSSHRGRRLVADFGVAVGCSPRPRTTPVILFISLRIRTRHSAAMAFCTPLARQGPPLVRLPRPGHLRAACRGARWPRPSHRGAGDFGGAGGLAVCHPVPLPAAKGWRRLDDKAAHEEFATGAAALANRAAAEEFGRAPKATIAIDWTGAAAWFAMSLEWPEWCVGGLPPCLYINFRVYSSGISPTAETPPSWYDEKEKAALGVASSVLALSQRDRASLKALLGEESATPVEVLLPCLRGDMQALTSRTDEEHAEHLPPAAAAAAAGASRRRCFLACVVRLSKRSARCSLRRSSKSWARSTGKIAV